MALVSGLSLSAIVAFSSVPAGFDPGVLHHLEIVAGRMLVSTP